MSTNTSESTRGLIICRASLANGLSVEFSTRDTTSLLELLRHLGSMSISRTEATSMGNVSPVTTSAQGGNQIIGPGLWPDTAKNVPIDLTMLKGLHTFP